MQGYKMHSGSRGTQLIYIRLHQVQAGREREREREEEGEDEEEVRNQIDTCRRSSCLSTSVPSERSVCSSAGGWCEDDLGRRSEVSSST